MKLRKKIYIALCLSLSLQIMQGCASAQAPDPQESKAPPVAEAPDLKTPNPQNADELYAYAEALERKGEEEKAMGFYVQATQVNPDHLKSQIALAQLYVKFNRMDEAKVAYESILRLDREHPFVAQYKEARLKYYSALNIAQNEEYDKALQLVSQAPRNTPLDKEIDESTQKWKAMLNNKSDDKKADEIMQQASLLAYKGKYKDAIELLKTAPNADTNPTILARLEQWNKAMNDASQTVQPIGPGASTSPNTSSPTANMRFVNADSVNIRQSPYLYAESLATLKRGAQVEILMDKAYESDGYQWSKVKNSEGTVGWVAANLLVTSLTAAPQATPLPSHPETNSQPATRPVGERTINGDNINIRRSPSLSGTLVSRGMSGTTVELLDNNPIKADGYSWMHIRLRDGQEGWVAANFLGSPKQVAPPAVGPGKTPVAPPVAPSSSSKTSSIVGSDINIRSLPSTQGKIVGRVSAPAQVTLLPNKPVKQGGYTWHAIKLSNGTQGWIVSQFLKTSGATAAPAKAPAQTSSRRRFIRGDKVNIRKDSNTQSKIILVASEGTPVTLLSDKLVKSQGFSWAKIRLPNGEIGWVAAQFIGR